MAVMLSGGSPASVSVIWLANTVTVQITPMGKFEVGSSVKLVAGEELSVNAWVFPGAGHSIWNELVVALTDSLKLIVMLVFAATPVAPLVGVVVVTDSRSPANIRSKTGINHTLHLVDPLVQ